jgi:hypothetical protein
MTRPHDVELARLDALASNLEISMRALINAYPELRRDELPDDALESRTAARLVDLHSQLLCAIERHRLVLEGWYSPDTEWPF